MNGKIPKNQKIIKFLLNSGANARIKNDYGQTPVFFGSQTLIKKNGLLGVPALSISEKDLKKPTVIIP